MIPCFLSNAFLSIHRKFNFYTSFRQETKNWGVTLSSRSGWLVKRWGAELVVCSVSGSFCYTAVLCQPVVSTWSVAGCVHGVAVMFHMLTGSSPNNEAPSFTFSSTRMAVSRSFSSWLVFHFFLLSGGTWRAVLHTFFSWFPFFFFFSCTPGLAHLYLLSARNCSARLCSVHSLLHFLFFLVLFASTCWRRMRG